MIYEESTQPNATELQSALNESNRSALEKYVELNVGRKGLISILRYDLACWILAPMPGMLGYFLRSKLYPGLLSSAGRGIVLGRNILFRHPGRITLGARTIVDDNCVLDAKGKSEDGISIGEQVVIGRNTIISCKGGSIEIGDNSNISANCMLTSESRIRIGKNVLMAGMSYLVAGGNHGTMRTDIPIIQQPMTQNGGIEIEDNCWLGANVTILDGVTIGRDSIVGAGAVVTESIPDFSVAAGVP
ncbi:MAG TPA: acyltransferase, partial [Armatimonadota bacterium]